jgi:anthranilate synthase component II
LYLSIAESPSTRRWTRTLLADGTIPLRIHAFEFEFVFAVILLIDNYDSFVYNLARYLRLLGQRTMVVRNDAMSVEDISQLAPQAIVLSPGPGTPADAGCSVAVVEKLAGQVPILGVCLGHQAIAAAFGARIMEAAEPMHGRTSHVEHDGEGIFRGLPRPLEVCRYHSLIIEPSTLSDQLHVTAHCDNGLVMALQHRWWPIVGVQFHPEAILTQHGFALLANYLELARLAVPDVVPLAERELRRAAPRAWAAGSLTPVTF